MQINWYKQLSREHNFKWHRNFIFRDIMRAPASLFPMLQALRPPVPLPVHQPPPLQSYKRWNVLSTLYSEVEERSRDMELWGAKWTSSENNNSAFSYWSKLQCSCRTNQGQCQYLLQPMCHSHCSVKNAHVTRGLRDRCRQRMPMLSVRTAVTQRLETYCKTLTRSLLINVLALPD